MPHAPRYAVHTAEVVASTSLASPRLLEAFKGAQEATPGDRLPSEGGDRSPVEAEFAAVYCARVSNPKNQDNLATAPRLLAYLMAHKHWSPFEMVNLVLEVNTTRSISAQILRHRSFSFQEFSTRYAEPGELPPIGLPYLRTQDTKNRQASHDNLAPEIRAYLERRIADHHKSGAFLYADLIDAGVAKECAREVLPLGSPTRLYMNGTARSWLHYLMVRTGPETQAEHRAVALAAWECFREAFPTIAEAARAGCPNLAAL
jgi:thymidylate synthase (FAD)